MPHRVIKIILPEGYGRQALDLLELQKNISYWQEESSGGRFVASVLTNSGMSESIMDLFEKKFSAVEGFRLILFPVEAALPRDDINDAGRSILKKRKTDSEKAGSSRVSREELYADVADSAGLSDIFITMTILSTIVAAIGLLKGNVAVIIGAMVIAPFLGPNVALALSTNLADQKLGVSALKTLVTGVVIVLCLSTAMGYFFKTDPMTPEIASRTYADLSDIILALSSGCAGVLAFTTGAFSTLIGVMVAVALLPPLTVCGLLMGAAQYTAASGAFLLFATNIICINLAGVVTFLAQGVSPRAWWKTDKARKATVKAVILWSLILVTLAVIIFYWRQELSY